MNLIESCCFKITNDTESQPLATPANDNPHPMCLYLCPLKLDLPMKGAYSDTKFPKTGTTSSLQKHA